MVAYGFKRRFVDPIRVGLGILTPEPKLLHGWHGSTITSGPPLLRPKRQTIRAIGLRRHARPGENLQLYCGMRTKQCFLIGLARCVAVRPIRILVRAHSFPIAIDGDHVRGGRIHEFAAQDGFASAEDMHAFWKREHGLGQFDGVLIQWEPIGNDDEEEDAPAQARPKHRRARSRT